MVKAVKLMLCAAAGIILCSCAADETVIQPEITVSTCTETSTDETALNIRHDHDERKLACSYFDGMDFDRFELECTDYDVNGEIMCGTVPHHLLAGRMISGFFRAAERSRENVDTVIIIATMHEPKGTPLCTTSLDWQTPFGTMETDGDIVSLFMNELGAKDNDNMLEKDHSASSIIPFARYYFPGAQCACLLVSGDSDMTVPGKLTALLEEYMESKSCLVVFSTDFSHYLSPQETESRDDETYDAVMESRYDDIGHMTNANVDSARCLETFTRLGDSFCNEKTMLDHSNSLIMSAQPYSQAVHGEGLTSYFVFVGTR